MKISQAEKILKDSRYGADKKKEARIVLREAKKAGKLVKPTRKKKTTTKSKAKTRVKASTKASTKTKTRSTKVKRKLKRKTKKTSNHKTRTKASARKTKTTSSRKKTTKAGKKIKFYDVKTKKYVRIPREDCRLKRSRTARGGDRLVGKYKGRELHTFVPKGFVL